MIDPLIWVAAGLSVAIVFVNRSRIATFFRGASPAGANAPAPAAVVKDVSHAAQEAIGLAMDVAEMEAKRLQKAAVAQEVMGLIRGRLTPIPSVLPPELIPHPAAKLAEKPAEAEAPKE